MFAMDEYVHKDESCERSFTHKLFDMLEMNPSDHHNRAGAVQPLRENSGRTSPHFNVSRLRHANIYSSPGTSAIEDLDSSACYSTAFCSVLFDQPVGFTSYSGWPHCACQVDTRHLIQRGPTTTPLGKLTIPAGRGTSRGRLLRA